MINPFKKFYVNYLICTVFLISGLPFIRPASCQEVEAVLWGLVYAWAGVFGLSIICALIFTGVQPVSKDFLFLFFLLLFVNITSIFIGGAFGKHIFNAHMVIYFVSALVICHFFRKKLINRLKNTKEKPGKGKNRV
jgi:hypothetical protein